MKFISIGFVVVYFLTVLSKCLWSQTGTGGTQETVNQPGGGPGAKAIAMGGAFTAIADDGSSPFWNPAGLGFIERRIFSGYYIHQLLVAGAGYNFVSYLNPTLNFGSMGLGGFRIGVEDIDGRDNNNNPLGTFDQSEGEYFLGYAYRYSWLASGFMIKYVTQEADPKPNPVSDAGVGLDLGFMIKTPESKYQQFHLLKSSSFGLSFKNVLEPNLKLIQTAQTYPFKFSAGISKSFYPSLILGRWYSWKLDDKLVLALNLDKKKSDFSLKNWDLFQVAMGLEYRLYEMLSFRMGYTPGLFGIGAGGRLATLTFDYAFSYRDQYVGGTHHFSLSYEFGRSIEQLRQKVSHQRILTLEKKLSEKSVILVDEYLQKGIKEFENKNYDRALFYFQYAVDLGREISSHDENARTQISQKMSEIDNLLNKAKVALESEQMNRLVEAAVEKGRFFLEREKYFDAYFELIPAAEKLPKHPLLDSLVNLTKNKTQDTIIQEKEIQRFLNIGDEYFVDKKYPEAMEVWRKILVFDKNNYLAHLKIKRADINMMLEKAQVYRNEMRSDKYLELLYQTLKIDPENEMLQRLIREAETETASRKKIARVLFEDARKMEKSKNPDHPAIVHKLNEALRLDPSLREAKQLLDAILGKAFPQQPGVEMTAELRMEVRNRYEQGIKFYETDQLDRAIGEMEFVYSNDSTFEKVRDRLVMFYQLSGMREYVKNNLEKSIQEWEKALVVDPLDEKSRMYLEKANTRIKKIKEIERGQ